MDIFSLSLFQLIINIVVFLALVGVGRVIYNRIKNNSSRYLNPQEYLPLEEITTLRQVFYLIMMALCFVNILYSLVFTNADWIYLVIFDIALSVYVAVAFYERSWKYAVLLLLLVPYGSLTYVFFGFSLVSLIDLIHVPIFLYFIKKFYDKFRHYTQSNGLGVTIIFLFVLIFVSFLITQVVEGVNALDALVMVSNAFTSNGYSILGSSIPGKFNAIVLVWSGYVLSGVGTATMTTAILIRHFNHKFDELEKLIKENNKDE